jgi:uncharacterized membrane protein
MARNINQELREKLGPLDKFGVWVTTIVGTMWCAILFTIIALVSLPQAVASRDSIIIVSWVAQTFLQLVLLPIIIVGQNLQSRHAELRAEADFDTNVKAEKEIQLLKEMNKEILTLTKEIHEFVLKDSKK